MKNYKLILILTFNFLLFLLFPFNNIYANVDLNLNCKANIAINSDDNTILFEKNAKQRVYPASTTKILTALITLEKMELNDTITITKEMIEQIPYNSSVMGIKENETYTVKDLLYGLLLVSGNDVAIVLADTISGNMDDFAIIMNEKLKEIGCNDTHFVNSHGYHDDNHYTTAYDMAILFNYCLKNDTFKEIINTKNITVTPTNNKDRIFELENSNYMLYEDSELYCKDIKGGKTGFTYEADGTFIGYATRDDMTIVIGSFGGSLDENNLSSRFTDTAKISNYIFDNFEKTIIAKKEDFCFSFKDLNNSKIYSIGMSDDLYGIVPKNYILNYTIDTNYNTMPYNFKSTGKITFNFSNSDLSYTKDLYILSTRNYYTQTNTIIYISLIIIVAIFILKIKQMLFSKKRYRNYKYKHQKMLNGIK